MAALRPLLTATAAGGMLAALWFVPSANATVEVPQRTAGTAGGTSQAQQAARTSAEPTASTPSARTPARPDAALALADTGSVDTTPYVIGGTAFLGIGAGFMTYSVRRRGATGTPGGLV
ncbi:hypothetical protein [Streptomyces sp. NPDC048442]|uniref:hypothetical protein n=1 Tax=Streptomyces sp. NPDC048442 TaxID=3154823 RepID=UPI003427DF0B